MITGCSGFVGRALAAKCLSSGWRVRGSLRSRAGKASIAGGVETVLISDIGPRTDWSAALQGVDVLVHLAALVHAGGHPPEAYRRVNAGGTQRLALEAAAAGVKRLVFLSTVKVNGEGRETPFTEDDPEDPRDPYAASKLEAERELRRISDRTGVEMVILRPPMVYGPGVRANFLRLIRMVERRLPLPLASVENRRSLIFVGNLAEAIEVCLHHPGAAGKTYLVSDAEAVSTPRLIREIGAGLGLKPLLFPMPVAILRALAELLGKTDDLLRLVGSLMVDASKIRRELDWKPEVSVSEGLRLTVNGYRAGIENRPGPSTG
jgi:nucleoside-diphosphate-sugar epimerase